ncbi:restriction endonuclease subunit S [Thomasclavelia cocleata]|uniref:restriction endonuclease subunit S n=1 Tax=Thomasclavelia cocleata TaxID=69824 RepID=UPI00255B2D44|nr:restriction endonuclease subunit S [Thomasclavelia cocleata]
MMKLSDREWKAISITSLFSNLEAGKINNASILKKTNIGGIEYIGATNRNNGCLYFVEKDEILYSKVQKGNCIGFIKDGDGSAGYAIYKKEAFVSTVNVIYGYADWLNKYTGLFFVTTQNLIKNKYSHGYKRNYEHLKGDKVMLPVNDNGEPDYIFMEAFIKEREAEKRKEYIDYCKKQLENIGGGYNLIPLEDKEWQSFFIVDIFDNIQRGKRLKTADHLSGKVPYVSSSSLNNGVDNFVSNKKGVRRFSNCISLANSGSVGSSFYEPFEFVASDHITHLKNEEFNKYHYLFLATMTSRLSQKYNFNREINDKRISREIILLPLDDEGVPDYEYMEQYSKNLICKKIRNYLDYVLAENHS